MACAWLCGIDRPALTRALHERQIDAATVSLPVDVTAAALPIGLLLLGTPAALADARAVWPGPLMVLADTGGEGALVALLESGADAAIPATTGDALIAAHAAALLRRGHAAPIAIGALTIDPVARSVTREGRPIALRPREFLLLARLAEAGGAPVSRAVLRAAVLGRGFETGTNAIEVHVSRLRERIDRGFGHAMLVTDKGVGYRLVAAPPIAGAPAAG